MPPTSTTVVQETLRKGLLDGEQAGQHDRRGGEQAGHRGGQGAGDEQHHHRGEHGDRPLRPRPQRDRLAADERRRVDDEHAGVLELLVERRPGAAQQQHVALGQLRLDERRACPWTASTTRSPLSVTMPGKTRLPMSAERGGITTSATPARRVTSASGGCSSSYWRTSVRACPLKSAPIVRAVRDGRSRSPSSATIAIVPTTSGTPTSANSKKPKRPTPASAPASDTTTFTGVLVSASSEPACAPKASGSSSCDGGRPSRTAITTTTGTSAATAPLTRKGHSH